jgi:hypothetical protein
MTSFALALASIAFVLVNMGIGWAFAKAQGRGSMAASDPSPAAERLAPREASQFSPVDVPDDTPIDTQSDEVAPLCDIECESSGVAIGRSKALASTDRRKYHAYCCVMISLRGRSRSGGFQPPGHRNKMLPLRACRHRS